MQEKGFSGFLDFADAAIWAEGFIYPLVFILSPKNRTVKAIFIDGLRRIW